MNLSSKTTVVSAILFASSLYPSFLLAQDGSDSVTFKADGTTHIQNLDVPIPNTISEAAKEMIKARNGMADPTRGFTAPITEIRNFLRPIQQSATDLFLEKISFEN